MKYHLIFYMSKKTSYCEKTVKRRLNTIDGEAHRVVCATEPSMLGGEVVRGLRVCPLTVIIGGLSSYGDDNLATVLSRVFSNSGLSLNNMRRLRAESGSDGYIIRYKSQILLALPDSPEDIEELCSDELLEYIREKTSPAPKSAEQFDETAEQAEELQDEADTQPETSDETAEEAVAQQDETE